MSDLQRGLLWIGGGVAAVILSQLLLAIGSLLGSIVLPVGALSILWGIVVLVQGRKPRGESPG